MSDPEPASANDALTAAIDAAQRANEPDTEGVLTSYLVIAKRRYWDNDVAFTAISVLSMDNGVPMDEQLGLLDYSATVLRSEIAQA